MKIMLVAVLAGAVLTEPCGVPVERCSAFCGPRPIKSIYVVKETNTGVCECEEYVPCVIPAPPVQAEKSK